MKYDYSTNCDCQRPTGESDALTLKVIRKDIALHKKEKCGDFGGYIDRHERDGDIDDTFKAIGYGKYEGSKI